MTGPFCPCGALGRPVLCYACQPEPEEAQKPRRLYRERSRAYYHRNKEACVARVKAWQSRQEGDAARAHAAVYHALKSGDLVRPRACTACGDAPPPRKGSTSGLEAHHHSGYERAHWLAVEWLCKPCHAIADKAEREARVSAKVDSTTI